MPAQKTSKEDILKKALMVFRKQGYHATSIADLSKVCDIPKSHFYYYFENKESLMQEILQVVEEYFRERVMAVANDTSLSPHERLENLGERLKKVYKSETGGCIMGNTVLETMHLGADQAFAPVLKSFFDGMIEALHIIYQEVHTEEKAKEMAEAGVQDLQGGIMLMQLYDDKHYMHAAIQRTQNRLLTPNT